jgi:hypothetical protein
MQIYTVQRLKALKPGETMIAYVGNFEQDIAFCSTPSGRNTAPTYKRLLTTLDNELKRLQLAGIIQLTKTSRQRKFEKGRVVEDIIYEVKRLSA